MLPPTVPLELAPKVCSHCGGRWRLEDDLMAGKRLICTVCATDMFVY
jgi:formylmethanofuran dehydrogenase subunit E